MKFNDTTYDYSKLNLDQLKALKDKILIDINRLKATIKRAKSKAQFEGKHSDYNWFNKQNNMLRIKQEQHQLVMQEAGKRKRENREKQQQILERRFMDIAKVRLTEELFYEMLNDARTLCGIKAQS